MTADTPIRGSWVDAESEGRIKKKIGVIYSLGMRLSNSLDSVHTRPGGEIQNHSFISTVRPTDHTNPSRKKSFAKTLLKSEKFEKCGFTFLCGRKHFKKGELQ